MTIEEEVAKLMALVEHYGEMREWHGARPGDDRNGQLEAAENAVREALVAAIRGGAQPATP